MFNLDNISSQHIELILALSLHDSKCIDFYYGHKNPKSLALGDIKTKTHKILLEISQYQIVGLMSLFERVYQIFYQRRRVHTTE